MLKEVITVPISKMFIFETILVHVKLIELQNN
jgi:hypothetical protein